MKEKKLIIGLGTSGSKIVDNFAKSSKNNDFIRTIVFDTIDDVLELTNVNKAFSLSTNLSLGDVVNAVGYENIAYFFPNNDKNKNSFLYNLRMDKGANGFRLKGLLLFIYFLSDENNKNLLLQEIKNIFEEDEEVNYKFYIVSSLCGGSGSSISLTLAFFIKKFFRENFNKEILSNGLFLSSDIYNENVYLDIKNKMNANAYATLKEINSINNLIINKNDSLLKNINIKIGDESNKYLSLLFDSNDIKFLNKKYLPFNKIYLFNRFIGEHNISTHEYAISDVLYSLVNNYFIDDDPRHIYGTISFSEVRFPFETISKYVSHKFILDSINNSVLDANKNITNYIKSEEKEAKEQHKNLNISSALNIITSFAKEKEKDFSNNKNTYDFDDFSSYLLKRKNPDITYEVSNQHVSVSLINKWHEKISKDLFVDNDFEIFKDNFNDKCFKHIKKLSKFAKGNKKNKALEHLKERASKYYSFLNEYYKNFISNYLKNRETYLSQFMNENEDELSFSYNQLMSNNKYIHPLISYIRVAQINNILSNKLEDFILNDEEFNYILNGNEHNLYLKFLLIKKPKKVKNSFYSNFENYRFSTYAYKNLPIDIIDSGYSYKYYIKDLETIDLKNPKFDDIAFKNDCFYLFNIIKQQLSLFIIKDFELLTRKLGEKYQLFFEKISHYKNLEYKCNDLYKQDCIASKLFINVGGDFANKDNIYSLYMSELTSKENKYQSIDNILGKEVLHILFKCDDINFDIDSFINNCVLESQKLFNNSDTYKDLYNQNIIKILENSLKNDNEVIYKIASFDSAKINDIYINPSKMFISKNTFDFIKNKMNIENIDSNIFVENYINDLCSSEFDITYKENLNDHLIFIGKIYNNLDLTNFTYFNEEVNDSFYADYQKALSNVVFYNSEIWNPHIYELSKDYYLCSISDKYENKKIKEIIKAFMYLLISESIYPIKLERDNDIFYAGMSILGNVVPLSINNNYILFDDYSSIFEYLRKNEKLSSEYSKLLDEKIDSYKRRIPTKTGIDNIGYESGYIIKYFEKLDLINNIQYKLNRKTIHNFIYFGYTLKNNDKKFDKFLGENIIKTSFEILNSLIEYKSSDITYDSLFKLTYKKVIYKLSRYQEFDDICDFLINQDIVKEDLIEEIKTEEEK